MHQADGHAAPERAENAAHAAQHHAGVHDDHEVEADIGLERIEGGDQAAGDRGDAGADAEGDAVRAVDVDAHIGRGARVVARRGASCRAASGDEPVERGTHDERYQRRDHARLVEEDVRCRCRAAGSPTRATRAACAPIAAWPKKRLLD